MALEKPGKLRIFFSYFVATLPGSSWIKWREWKGRKWGRGKECMGV